MEVKSLKKNVGNASPFVNRIFLLSLQTPRPPSFAGLPLVLLPKNAGTRQHPESSVTLERELQLNFQPI